MAAALALARIRGLLLRRLLVTVRRVRIGCGAAVVTRLRVNPPTRTRCAPLGCWMVVFGTGQPLFALSTHDSRSLQSASYCSAVSTFLAAAESNTRAFTSTSVSGCARLPDTRVKSLWLG